MDKPIFRALPGMVKYLNTKYKLALAYFPCMFWTFAADRKKKTKQNKPKPKDIDH